MGSTEAAWGPMRRECREPEPRHKTRHTRQSRPGGTDRTDEGTGTRQAEGREARGAAEGEAGKCTLTSGPHGPTVKPSRKKS